MAIFKEDNEEMITCATTSLDELYCEEEQQTFELVEEEEDEERHREQLRQQNTQMLFLLQEDDMFCEEQLQCLLTKEQNESTYNTNNYDVNGNFNEGWVKRARKEAVKWMVKVNTHYGFSALTSILSVNYFDKCVSRIPFITQQQQPWTFQLAAVTCVSLAAKVEEPCVPHILDLQVEGARLVFEPKDVQKMELLVLSTLEWKMHPVTPLSFLDHLIRRLGLNHQLHWEFLNKCESVLLSLLCDWRFGRYLPSVLATATMMHAIDQIHSCDPLDYHIQLLNLLHISKEEVKECHGLIVETSKLITKENIYKSKRKFDLMMNNNSYTNTSPSSSPSGVMDAYWFSSDSSNDSWAATSNDTGGRLSVPTSVSSSPVMSGKRGRVHEQPMTLQLPSLAKVFVDVIESPR